MNVSIDQLAQSFLQKNTLEQCSVSELQQITARYPYFAAAQLLLTKKSFQEDQLFYKEQLQKTSLFFSNPLWLKHLLDDNGKAGIIVADHPQHEKSGPEIADEITTELLVLPQQQPINTEEKINDQVDLPEPEDPVKAMEMPELKIERPDNYRNDLSQAELTFEPYHTVDYFASQGIQFKEEEKPKDKFSQQLKSFTEWLKTMKRLPAEVIASTLGGNAEQKVDQLAEHSIEDREVITEAMAEVWEKQGNTAKAIEIYSKLSLLDPSKSSYFAAKIGTLKKIN